jgi:hypothetical protein
MKPIFLAIALSFYSVLFAQDNAFPQIQCAGEMPDDFKSAFGEKYEKYLAQIDGKTELSSKSSKEFAVENGYFMHKLLDA